MPPVLVWIDLEMTGLDHRRDVIVEIASVVTDDDLVEVAEGPCCAIATSPTLLAQMVPEVHEMHTETGLIDRIGESTVTAAEAEAATVEFIRTHVPNPGSTPLCGNSIGTDRRFLDAYMPAVERCLSYRVVDVSSFREMAQRLKPELVTEWKQVSAAREGVTKHRALDDVRTSIEELRLYRDRWLAPAGVDVANAAQQNPAQQNPAAG